MALAARRAAETVEALGHVPFGGRVEEGELFAFFETAGSGEDEEGGGVK